MNDITSKALVRGAFESAELPRLPFVPWVFRHAARLEQVPLQRMYGDPTQYVKCLQNARKLYGYDAVIGGFDPSLEAEIAGLSIKWAGEYGTPAAITRPGFDPGRLEGINVLGSGRTGRFGTVVESLRRICTVSGSSVAMVAVVSGPLTLAAALAGRDPIEDLKAGPDPARNTVEAAARFLLKVVQTYCQLELDVIAFGERPAASIPAAHLPWMQSVLAPILNTVRFYNAASVLLPGDVSGNELDGLIDLGYDGIVAAGIDLITWNRLKRGRNGVLGKAIPAGLISGAHDELKEYLKEQLPDCAGEGIFLTTDGEVPPDTPPENIRLVMDMISK
jgi:uroporphyrinogen-III decarboxylase